MVYLPVYVDVEKDTTINLGVAYNTLEDCLEFLRSLGYNNRAIRNDRYLYINSDDDSSYARIEMIEMR